MKPENQELLLRRLASLQKKAPFPRILVEAASRGVLRGKGSQTVDLSTEKTLQRAAASQLQLELSYVLK